ncbi:MAG: hypothetical protein QX196_10605 [Methylococcaceae bacterium]
MNGSSLAWVPWLHAGRLSGARLAGGLFANWQSFRHGLIAWIKSGLDAMATRWQVIRCKACRWIFTNWQSFRLGLIEWIKYLYKRGYPPPTKQT